MTPLPPPTDLLNSFLIACESLGLDGTQLFDHYHSRGYVMKGPDYFMMGEPLPDRKAWFVFWAESLPGTEPACRRFLRMMPYYLPEVAFARSLKGRTHPQFYSTARLLRLHKIPWVEENLK